MIKLKDIGIRKDSGGRLMIGITLTVPILVAAVVFWLFYSNEFKYEYLLENGVEAEATVISYGYDYPDSTNDGSVDTSSGWYYTWECYYNGKRYSGISGHFRTEEIVSEYLGTKFTITVDPNSSFVVDKPLSEISKDGFHYIEYLTCAIVFTCLSPFFILAFIKFAIYPTILNSKIDKCGKLPVQGEVIKAKGWIFKYVKVSCEDKGILKEKWSYDWLTRKEAKFLQQKKTITIVPYKNTYGILEEMQVERKK